MLGKVHVLSKEKFASWEDGSAKKVQKASSNLPPAEVGRQLYSDKGCVACHSIDGADGVGPTWKGLFGKNRIFADGTSILADENYIKESILYPGEKIVEGYGPVMPSYKGLLEDSDITAIIEYIKSLK
jgi:cytochrome c oxidase subunit 2